MISANIMDVWGLLIMIVTNQKNISYNILVFLMRSERGECSLGDVCGSNPELTVWDEMTVLLF